MSMTGRLVCAVKGHIITERTTGCYWCPRCKRFVMYPCRVDRLR